MCQLIISVFCPVFQIPCCCWAQFSRVSLFWAESNTFWSFIPSIFAEKVQLVLGWPTSKWSSNVLPWPLLSWNQVFQCVNPMSRVQYSSFQNLVDQIQPLKHGLPMSSASNTKPGPPVSSINYIDCWFQSLHTSNWICLLFMDVWHGPILCLSTCTYWIGLGWYTFLPIRFCYDSISI